AAVPQAARDYQAFSRLRRPYQILMRVALLEYARTGNLAYFGYSGHLLLKKIQHFVRVRLLAPVDLRIRTTMSRLDIGKEEAEGYIRGVDEERTRWARFMYGRDIRDPGLYDICINMEEAELVTGRETYTYEVGASAHAGTVLLEGPYLEPEEKERVMAVADGVPGVKKVEYRPGYAPTMEFLPS
ncbi:MAG: cytidylate kinase family protein, partial [Acidobacteriota bacterium]